MKYIREHKGFTLIEVVLVIVVAGILAGVAMRGSKQIADTARVEETKQELEALSVAILGNSALENSGIIPDFGYVGDIGSLPPNLDALVTNPGGYSTWSGPYIHNRFAQTTDDYKRDSWNSLYSYTGGLTITSTGSGSNIVQNLAPSTGDILLNSVSGLILDINGSPPGTVNKDSLQARLTYPDGAGGMVTRVINPDAGGFFQLDSIPIGNQEMKIIYIPLSDTLLRFQSVKTGSSSYQEYRLNVTFPAFSSGTTGGGGGAIVYVAGTVNFDGGDCEEIGFSITNTSGSSITLTSMILSWTGPVAWYDQIKFGGKKIWKEKKPANSTGDLATFKKSQVVAPGQTIPVIIKNFRDQNNGKGNDVNMSNVTFTVTFSDGSTFNVTTLTCP